MLVAVIMTAMSYAQVDTAFFAPGKPGNYELKVDTVKHSALKEIDPASVWYVGFPETGGYVARKVKVEETRIDESGKLFLYNRELASSWDPNFPELRTITLFYGYRVTTRSSETEYFTKEQLEGMIKDTVAVLHLVKDLKTIQNPTDLVTSFQVNKFNDGIIKLTEGDTAKFTVEAVNKLDIQKYMLASNKEIIAESDSGYFELVPYETIKDISLVVSNKSGEYFFPWLKTLEVYPKFDVTNIMCSVYNNGKTISTENPDSNELEVEVFNHDSVQLKVETNITEVLNPTNVVYSWNKDGKSLPEGITVNKNILTISEYSKPDMDGTYNCITTANDTTIISSFIFKSEFPASVKSLEKKIISSYNGNIIINNVQGEKVIVIDSIGRIIYSSIPYSGANIKVEPGIYFVIISNKTYKLEVR